MNTTSRKNKWRKNFFYINFIFTCLIQTLCTQPLFVNIIHIIIIIKLLSSLKSFSLNGVILKEKLRRWYWKNINRRLIVVWNHWPDKKLIENNREIFEMNSDQRCVIAFFFKSITKYITKDFNFAQLHYQLKLLVKNNYFSIISYITNNLRQK